MSYSLWEQRLTIFWAGVVGSLLGKKCCMRAVRHSYPRILFQSLVNCHLDPLGSTWHFSQEAKGSRDFKSAWAALCRLSRLAQMVKARAHGLHRQDWGWRFGGKPTFITVSIAELCFVFFCCMHWWKNCCCSCIASQVSPDDSLTIHFLQDFCHNILIQFHVLSHSVGEFR